MREPTWVNHGSIFEAAGIGTASYPYYDAAAHGLAGEPLTGALRTVPAGDVVLLHGCCHNPTGVDPALDQWQQLSEICDQAGWLPFFDFAYQGLGDGLEDDAAAVRAFAVPGRDMLVASSFSKNFGLYCQRVGALSLVASTPEAAKAAQSHVKRSIRANYSNPPAHGARLVVAVLSDPEPARWERDVKDIATASTPCGSSSLTRSRPRASRRISRSSRTRRHVLVFRHYQRPVDAPKNWIYIVGSGRINVADDGRQHGLFARPSPASCKRTGGRAEYLPA